MTMARPVPPAGVGTRAGGASLWELGIAALATAACLCLSPPAAVAQGGRVRVEYDVEFSTRGPLLDSNCPATGTDVLTGTLVGFEPALPDEPNEYVGKLMRSTRISVCGSRTNAAGVDVVCSINIAGGGFPVVILTVESGQQGAWLKYLTNPGRWTVLLRPPPAGQAYSTVTGTCDPAELAHLQASYDNGDTAGSPSGQPIELPGLPPPGIPATFAANHPESIWTLKVLARRP